MTVIGPIIIVFSLKEARRKELEEEKEPIEMIGHSAPNQPVRFKINKTRLGRDAWVGIYPVSADDQDHGGRWSWLRDIDVNDATLPGQPAGKWSIRVFKDGGYILKHRLDFEITDDKFSDSAKRIQSALKDSSESGSTNFWDTVE